MGSLTTCLKQIGDALSIQEKRDIITERQALMAKEGLSATAAADKVVLDRLTAAIEDERQRAKDMAPEPTAAAEPQAPEQPAGPTEAELQAQAAAEEARKAAIEARRASREAEREVFRSMLSNPEIVGMSAKNIAVLVDAKAGDRVAPEQRALLARAIHKEAERRAAELAKQKHRDPAVFGAALAAAKEQDNIPADDTDMQSAYALGWTHALQGKTKSTLTGDSLNVRVHGYEAARAWMKTEEGAAWYEGRPVNKLQNTGIDLRRWYEQLQAQMKADEPDIKKAWKQIERATSRSDLFAPLLPDGVTPGYRLYVTEVRDLVRPFKAWLEAAYSWSGEEYSRSRYSGSNKSNTELMLQGLRYPSTYSYGRTVKQQEADAFENDEAFRAQWLRDRAAEYLAQVRDITSVIEGTSSVAEAAGKWADRYIITFSDKRWNLDSSMLTQAGQALVRIGKGARIDAWAGETWDVMSLAGQSEYVQGLVANEKTVELPTKATPLVRSRLDTVNRTGPDLRQGADVTPLDFKARFGFADVGFGTWVGAREDQDHLNYAHDAFVDLARFYGVPETAIGFGGRMHFTIGALGRGKYGAHFSPNQPSPVGPVQVINLTNTQGDGAVAHEWAHALDHNLGGEWRDRVRPLVLRYLTTGALSVQQVESTARRFLVGDTFWKGDKRGDKVDAAVYAMSRNDVLRKMSAYKANADKLGEDYWGNEEELIARASEAWVFDSLGHTSDYLVNDWVAEGKVTQDKGYRGTPYPTGEERKVFNQVFTALAKAIKWEGGKPTVTKADFEAALPAELTVGERRRIELSDRKAMQALHEQLLAEIEDKKAAEAQAQADAAAEERRRLDELAEQKLRELQPPPATVDAPQPSESQGPLSDEELSALFDQAAAEVREETQEQPEVPATNEAEITSPTWKAADWQEIHRHLAKGVPVLLTEEGHGIPTIHEFARLGKTDMVGFGVFKTVGDGWTANWDGGGAMQRTAASSMSYTTVQFSDGTVPAGAYSLQAAADSALANRRAAEPSAAAASDKPARAPKNSPANSREDDNPTARELIAKAAALGVKGADEALTGLAKLFGSKPGRLNSFPAGFDEEAYKEALPYFRSALKNFQEAGKTLKDLFKVLIQVMGDGVKMYAIQFAKDEGLANNLAQQPQQSASMTLARDIEKHLLHVVAPMDWRTLFNMADRAFGGTQADGKYTPKDAYDALEAGINLRILRSPQIFSPNVGPEDAMRAVAALTRLLEKVPTQTKRTAEQDQLQQFSTVPPLAFVANWVAGVRATDVMLEPSAGVGGLSVFAKAAGAKVVMNEWSARRAALLQEVMPDSLIFREDAQYLHNILPDSVRPTVVVMNPPFSNSTGGIKDTMVGAQHVEQALQRLPDGGRLVAIVGEGMAMDKAAFKGWWKKISARYDVRAAVPMDGSGYAKYGTTFDNVILVIDKVKPSGRKPVTTPAKEYTELVHLLTEVRNERPEPDAPQQDHSAEPDARRDEGEGTAAGDGQTAPAGVGDGGAAGVGAGQPGGQAGVGGSGQAGAGAGRGKGPRGAAGSDRAGGVPAGADTNGSGPADAAVGGGPGATGQASGVSVEAGTTAAGELTDSVFEGYQPQRLQVPGAKPHPGALVQSAAMASVLPPAPTYTPNLPKETIEKGLVSLAQIESTVYAGQAHAQLLEAKVGDTEARDFGLKPGTPYRRGFFIGDGTGVGKGREISAILLDNIRQGRKKHVWVSEKQGLMNDAARDFAGIQDGVTASGVLKSKAIFNQGETKAADSIGRADGIIFTTYATLRSEAKAAEPGGFKKGDAVVLDDGKTGTLVSINPKTRAASVSFGQGASSINFAVINSIRGDKNWQDAVSKAPKPKTRVDQLVEWLGSDFDGVIALDEAHNAGNAVAIKTDRGMSDPSAQAVAVVELQKRLPNARVVYVSATGATEVSNLSFATRLGIWGPGTPFASVTAFADQMTAGGLATMELVARDLKQTGSYMARSLSYDGVTYSRLDHELSPIQHDIYNRLAEAWQSVLNNMEAALQITGAVAESGRTKNSKAKAAALSAFWGAQQRFFNQIITSMQMPSVVEAVEADLARGDAVVLQLVNTNEAQQERAMSKRQAEEGEDADLEDLDLTPRDQLIDMVRKSFPVAQYTDVIDENGKKQTVQVMDSKGNPVENKEAVALRDALIKDLEQISVPDGPLEILVNHFGPDVVAEVTGRKQRVVSGRWNKNHKDDGEAKAFVDKRGPAAARVDADAFMADKKRILVFSDAGGTGFSFQADLTKANQRKRQHYLVQPGWRANKAVQGLGRTHRTNQASAPHYKLVATNIPAHKRFLSSIARRLDQLGALTKGQRDTSSGGLFSEKDNLESKYAERAVRRFLFDAKGGQVEGVEFNELLQQLGLKDMLHPETKAITESKIPEVRQFLNRLLSLKLDMQEKVFGAFIGRMEEIIEEASQRGELDTGMQTIRALTSKITHEETIYTDERTGAETSYVELELTHPTGIHQFPEEKAQGAKIEWVVNTTSGRVWGKVRSGNQTLKNGAVVERYRMLGTGGMSFRHAEELKAGYRTITEDQAREKWAFETGKKPPTYTTKTHMIVGAMLPIWDRIKTEGTMQVARTQTEDGRRLLGRVIHEKDVPELRKRLNIAAPESKLPPAEVLARVLKGEVAELANGWKLARARVSDDLRVEIKGLPSNMGPSLRRELIDAGVIEERISWNTRYFVPTSAPETLAAITKSRPVIGLSKPDDGTPLSRRGAGTGVALDDVRKMAMEASRDWSDREIHVGVVDTAQDLPADILAGLRRAGAEQSTRALMMPRDGRVFLVADKFNTIDEAQFALFHEVYGHIGLRAFLGDQYDAQMAMLRMANPALAAEANTWYANYATGQIAARVAQGMSRQEAERVVRLLAVEEALADRAGDAPPPSSWKALMAALQAGLRRLGLDRVANWLESLTEAETHALLMNARRAVMRTGGSMHALSELPATMQPRQSNEAPIWYSALLAEVGKAPMKTGTAQAWTQYLDAMVKRGAVKADEIEWTGLREWLQLQPGKVTRDEVGQYLSANGVQVQEVVLADNERAKLPDGWEVRPANRYADDTEFAYVLTDDQGEIRGAGNTQAEAIEDGWDPDERDDRPTKYGQYTLPGGTNYREVLLTLPVNAAASVPERYKTGADIRDAAVTLEDMGFTAESIEAAAAFVDQAGSPRQALEMQDHLIARGYGYTEAQRAAGAVLRGITKGHQNAVDEANRKAALASYKSGHWDQPNVLAHIRLNDRTDADGKRVLFVEEIQSDWAQQGKKQGFGTTDLPSRFTVRDANGNMRGDFGTREEAKAYLDKPPEHMRHLFDYTARVVEAKQKIDGPPRAPFVGKTDAWVALAIKRVIGIAAREGYDRVAFVNGQQSAERYDLSKQIDRIHYEKADDGKYELIAFKVGSRDESTGSEALHEDEIDLARVEALVGKEIAQKIADEAGEHIGGSYRGWRELKNVDLKVGGSGMISFYDKIVPAVAKDVLRKVGGGQITQIPLVKPTKAFPEGVQQPGFDITPQMMEKAATGLPLFSRAPLVFSEAFRRWFGSSEIRNDDGSPKLMYHGTGANITSFRAKQAGAIFLTDEPIFAQAYADASTDWLRARNMDAGQNILPVYVKAERPFDYDNPEHRERVIADILSGPDSMIRPDGKAAVKSSVGLPTLWDAAALESGLVDPVGTGNWSLIEKPWFQRSLRRQGFDGFWVNEGSFKNLGVYEPTQVKSAIGNSGAFDPANPSILLSQTPPLDPVTDSALKKAGIRPALTLGGKIVAFYGKAVEAVRDRQAIAEHFRQGALDQFYGIQRAAVNELGNLPVEQNPYITARLANGGTSSVMRALMLHGQARWNDTHQHLEKVDGTKGLLDILRPLGNDLNDWFGWMVGNRAERLMNEGRENNLTKDEIKALQGLANTEEKLAAFRKASLEYAAFKRSVLDVAQEAGLIDSEARKAWDHADYIPFYREIDERSVFSPTGRKGLSGQASGIRKLKGGESGLNDPMENLLMNFSRLIDASLKNNAIKATIEALEEAESDLVKKIGYDMKPAIVPRSQVIEVLSAAGTPDSIIATLPDEVFEGMAKMWAIQAPTDPDVVRVMVGGKPKFYRVSDQLLLRALTSFVPFDFPGLALMRGAKRLLTATVTATPEFMLRNWVRDSMAAQAITETPFNPLESVKGIRRAFKETGGYEAMLFAGASFQSGHVNAADPEGTAIHMRRALRQKGFRAAAADAGISQAARDTAARAWEGYRAIGESIENANREAVYEAAIKGGKSVTEAAFEAKDLMDFSLRGSWAGYQLLADVLPFFNARVQGLYRLGRSDPKRLMMVGTMMLAATAMLALANAGEDWYERLPDWEKDTYWHIKVGGHHFKIPKPFELGVIFATIPERIARGFMGLDSGKKTLSRVWANLRDQLAFDPVPQLARPALDVWANKDTFRDRAIEGMADEGKRPHARSDARTSDTMRVIAEAGGPVTDYLDLGPKKLEHLINGYFGTVGMYGLAVANAMVRKAEGKPDRPAMRADDLPIVRAFYSVDPARSTVFENDVYKMRQEADAIIKEMNAKARSMDANERRKALELLRDETPKLQARGLVNGGAKLLTQLNQQISQVYADPNMTPDQKRAKVDALQERKNAIAQKVATNPQVRAAF